MTENLTFDWEGAQEPEDKRSRNYLALGVPHNPFIDAEGLRDPRQRPPLYAGHIRAEMGEIQDWVTLAYTQAVNPLSLIGGIGLGKTHLLRFWERLLVAQADERRLAVLRVALYDYGAQQISLGNLMLARLRDWTLPSYRALPEQAGVEVIPLVWQLACADAGDQAPQSLMERHIQAIQRLDSEEKRLARARLFCRWLNRADLTSKEARELGEPRRIDWEGELITHLCDLVGVAERLGVCRRVYFMVDQLEDLFRSNITPMRRSRLLTDLRHLIDGVIDRRAPIALMLAWSTEIEHARGMIDVKRLFNSAYPALMDRMQSGKVVTLKQLAAADRKLFARAYIEALKDTPGYNATQVILSQERLVERASKLAKNVEDVEPTAGITPRRWLRYLAQAMDELATEAAG